MKKNLKDKLQKIYDDHGSRKILETLSEIFIEKGIAFNADTMISLAGDLNESIKKHWGYPEINPRNPNEVLEEK